MGGDGGIHFLKAKPYVVKCEFQNFLMNCVPSPLKPKIGLLLGRVCLRDTLLALLVFHSPHFLDSGMYAVYKSERNLEIHVDSYNKIGRSRVTPSSLQNDKLTRSITENIMSRPRTMFHFTVLLPLGFEVFVDVYPRCIHPLSLLYYCSHLPTPQFYGCRKIAGSPHFCRKFAGTHYCRNFDWIGTLCRKFDALPLLRLH